jgi:polyisoprenoid-binding protein YceI
MKKITLFLIIALSVNIAFAQYKPDGQASSLKFTIKNLGFGVDGTFSGFDGIINFDPQNPANDNFDVTLKAATVNTDNSLRDDHLKGDGFFDVKNFPIIRLQSAKIAGKNNTYTLTGVLTIKGKSQAITFPFTATPAGDGLVFKGAFKIKRKDFGVGGTSTVSDELEVNINVVAKKV